MRIIDRLNVGGPAIHAVLTTKGLDPARFETLLVIGSVEPGEADMSYLLEQHGVTLCANIPALGRELRPLRDIRTALELYRLMKRERPDVVHTHKAKAGAIGRVAALMAGVPVRVHTFHGHVLRGYFSPFKSRIFRAIEQLLGHFSSRLVTVSDALADELSQEYRIAPRNRFTVVPLGFDLEPFAKAERHQGELRSELGVGPEVKLVGIVGRMVPVKDHATFVAAAEILGRRADVRFVFVGGGELEAEIRRRVESHGLAGRAHLLGWRRDLPRIYADLDVVVLSSINEGTPVSLIEAMASGVPVVSSDVGGVSDVLRRGERGELVSAKDPVALAAAIERAFSSTARARAASIRASVVAEYGIERLCRDLEALYLDLLGPRTTAQSRRNGSSARP